MNSYVIERADGYCYRIETEETADELLLRLRNEYVKNDNVFSTFTLHPNRIAVAVYTEVTRLSNNE